MTENGQVRSRSRSFWYRHEWLCLPSARQSQAGIVQVSRSVKRPDSGLAISSTSPPLIRTFALLFCVGSVQVIGNDWNGAHISHYASRAADERVRMFATVFSGAAKSTPTSCAVARKLSFDAELRCHRYVTVRKEIHRFQNCARRVALPYRPKTKMLRSFIASIAMGAPRSVFP